MIYVDFGEFVVTVTKDLNDGTIGGRSARAPERDKLVYPQPVPIKEFEEPFGMTV